MKKYIFLIVILFIPGFFLLAQGQPGRADDAPEGMEYVPLTNNSTILVPQGTRIVRRGSEVQAEGLGVYVARELKEAKERIAELEKTTEELKKEIEELRLELSKKEKQE